jgi:hypothetical protein
MQIFINHLDGSQAAAQLNQNSEINSFLSAYNSVNCRLISQGEHINTTNLLLSLVDNSNVYVTANLNGGKKKKKKKVYTTKKKNKHIHKKPQAPLSVFIPSMVEHF